MADPSDEPPLAPLSADPPDEPPLAPLIADSSHKLPMAPSHFLMKDARTEVDVSLEVARGHKKR